MNELRKETSLELKYNAYKKAAFDKRNPNTENLNNEIKNLEETASETNQHRQFNISKKFIDFYNEKTQKEEIQNEKEKEKEVYDLNGNRLANIYQSESFINLHDPLGLYKKKGNYKDLAYKVFRDVDDEDVFMKVLYYPKLTYKDYNYMIQTYNQDKTSLNRRLFLSYGLVGGSALFAWSLSYKYSLKFTTFAAVTLGSFALVYKLTQNALLKSHKKSLNGFATDIATKYPEIKYATVHYVQS